MAATQVQLGEDDAVVAPDLRHLPDHAVHGGGEVGGVGDLRPEMAMEADEFEVRLPQDESRGVAGLAVDDGKPNFWSATPVATARWAWMSMPGVTRTRTPGRAGPRRGRAGGSR